MKKAINILVTLLSVVALAASCEKAPAVSEGIVAEWQLTEMTGYAAADLPEVYVDFKADLTFEIYQKVGDVLRYRRYDGTYAVEGELVKGEYSDGTTKCLSMYQSDVFLFKNGKYEYTWKDDSESAQGGNQNGTVKRIDVCTSCIRAGKVQRAI